MLPGFLQLMELSHATTPPFPLITPPISPHYSTNHPPFPPLGQCVYDILGCQNDWCVRSHALAGLLGAPKPALVQEIENIVRWAPATDAPPPATPWKEAEEEEDVPLQLLDGGEDPHSSEFKQLDPGTGEKLQFDVAFHIRTGDA